MDSLDTEDVNVFIGLRENERRHIGYVSLRSYIDSCKSMLEAADKILSESAREFDNTATALSKEEYAKRYCQHESAFACMEEAAKSLTIAQTLCVRLSGPVHLPPLERFSKAIDACNNPQV